MSALARQVCAQFFASLHENVGEARVFGIEPADRDWMEKFLILFALEDCQNSFKAVNRKPICRFSMGLAKEDTKAKLQKYLIQIRNDRLRKKYEKVAASSLQEWLVDFSLSNFSLPQARGDRRASPMPEGSYFELLMIAESEMGSKNQVLEDFVKLACITSPFKMMVYKAQKRNKDATILKEGFERIVRVARKEHDTAEWLFVGIPGYREWIDAWENPLELTTNVMYLPSSKIEVEVHNDWQKWPD